MQDDLQVVQQTWFARGGCATLYKAYLRTNSSQDRKPVVIKVPVLYASDSGETEENASALARAVKREIDVWSSLSYPNILPFLGTCHVKPGHLGLISPFCANGDINKYVARRPDVNVMLLLAEVAGAIDYLHSFSSPIIHGDIKGANILINDLGKACLADFGISRIFDVKGFTTKNALGTCRWSSVEILKEEIYNSENVVSSRTTKESDIWAFGMTSLEILTGQLPFFEIKRDIAVVFEIVLRGARPVRPNQALITDTVWTLLEACWYNDPAARPNSSSVALILDLIVGTRGEGVGLDVPSILLLLETDSERPGTDSIRRGQEKDYLCHFPNCCSRFSEMDECVNHECAEYLNVIMPRQVT